VASINNSIGTKNILNKLETNRENRVGKGFKGSDFSLQDSYGSNSRDNNRRHDGIYDEEFYSKINQALMHPEQLEALQLSDEQLREYQNQKSYFESIHKGSDKAETSRSPASKVLEFKEASPVSEKNSISLRLFHFAIQRNLQNNPSINRI